MTTPATDEAIEALERIAVEWTFYAERFGIVDEIHNGVYSEDDLVTVARVVQGLIVRLRAAESARDAALCLFSQQTTSEFTDHGAALRGMWLDVQIALAEATSEEWRDVYRGRLRALETAIRGRSTT